MFYIIEGNICSGKQKLIQLLYKHKFKIKYIENDFIEIDQFFNINNGKALLLKLISSIIDKFQTYSVYDNDTIYIMKNSWIYYRYIVLELLFDRNIINKNDYDQFIIMYNKLLDIVNINVKYIYINVETNTCYKRSLEKYKNIKYNFQLIEKINNLYNYWLSIDNNIINIDSNIDFINDEYSENNMIKKLSFINNYIEENNNIDTEWTTVKSKRKKKNGFNLKN